MLFKDIAVIEMVISDVDPPTLPRHTLQVTTPMPLRKRQRCPTNFTKRKYRTTSTMRLMPAMDRMVMGLTAVEASPSYATTKQEGTLASSELQHFLKHKAELHRTSSLVRAIGSSMSILFLLDDTFRRIWRDKSLAQILWNQPASHLSALDVSVLNTTASLTNFLVVVGCSRAFFGVPSGHSYSICHRRHISRGRLEIFAE